MRRYKVVLLKRGIVVAVVTLLLHSLYKASYTSFYNEEQTPTKEKETIINVGELLREQEEKIDDEEAQDISSKETETLDSLAGGRHQRKNEEIDDESTPKNVESSKISEIKRTIEDINNQQNIWNLEKFGNITNSTTVIAIQVHNRATYLRYLIESLSISSNIDKSFLIFSHDVWDENINSIISSINFTRVQQIFFPHSLQLHPHTFPGFGPKDCIKNWSLKEFPGTDCTNSKWPDMHGHYREPKYSQTKHHWWWKANHIFHNIDVLKQFTGHVVFLEEDHYVAPDFMLLLDMMKYHQDNKHKNVDILSLGTYLRKFNLKGRGGGRKEPDQVSNLMHLDGAQQHRSLKSLKSFHQEQHQHVARHLLWEPSFFNSLLNMFHQAEITDWVSSKHNMGMSITRDVWNKIRSCASMFCTYDDYNWDWSLQKISLSCLKPTSLKVMVLKGPRIFHVGECGVHQKNKDCDHSVVVTRVQSILKTVKTYLYPSNLVVMSAHPRKLKMKKGNGGWADKRDHQLCLNMTRS